MSSRTDGAGQPGKAGQPAVSALLARTLPIGLLLLAWELTSRLEVVNPNVFPPVSAIFLRWAGTFVDGSVYKPLWDTVWRSVLGLAAAIVVGVPLGILMGRQRWAEWLFEPLFSFLFPLPKIALIPLYVHWFGLFDASKVMLIFTDCLFPVVLFAYHGARGVSQTYLWSAMARGTSRVRMLWRVVLPMSLASIYDGIQIAVVVALLVAVVSEMVSGGSGLGHTMIRAYRYGDVQTAFATLLTISLIGFAFYAVAQRLRDRLLFWYVAEH